MRVARILYPVTVLGPGKRIAIWVAGCSKRCQGCANPELWDGSVYPKVEMSQLEMAIEAIYEKASGDVDGITISGGEPFEQAEELVQLVSFLEKRTDDILVFSGKKKEELLQNSIMAEVLEKIAVLVDGEYIEAENEGEVLRGSRNQEIHIQKTEMKMKYEGYLEQNKGKHLAETFHVKDGVIVVGIHKKDFDSELEKALEKKAIAHR